MAKLHLKLSSLQDELAAVTAELHTKMDDVTEEIRQQKELLNSFAPISQIPNEILQRIFTMNRARHLFQDTRSAVPLSPALRKDCGVGPWDWIRVTHVCVRWRMVGLAQKELWSYMTQKQSPRAIEEFIKRSHPAPLSVTMSRERWNTSLLDQLHRIESLELDSLDNYPHHAGDASEDPAVSRTGSAPLLRRLWIRESPYIFPKIVQLLEGGTPSLLTLELVNCYLPWTSPLFHPGLARLRIRIPDRYRSPSQLSSEQFLDALERVSPGLVILELDMSLPETPDSTSRQIVFPKLEVLTLRCAKRPAIQSLLKHLVVPEKAAVKLSFDACATGGVQPARIGGEETKAQTILPVRFSNVITRPSSICGSSSLLDTAYSPLTYAVPPPRSLSFALYETPSQNTYTFRLWDHHVDFSLKHLPPSFLTCTVEDTTGKRWDAPPMVFHCLSSTGIRSLSLTHLPDKELDRFRVLVSLSHSPSPSFGGVEDLWVGKYLARNIVYYLMEEIEDTVSTAKSGPSRSLPKCFPMLRSLTFERMVFVSASQLQCSVIKHIVNGKPVVFDDLLRVLEFRAKSGAMVEILRFLDCYDLSASQAENIEASCGRGGLEWGGQDVRLAVPEEGMPLRK
ncbi:hypothetical protein CC1G_05443 [Coprinopsis cinerea okayama7|uniref:Uncharacterized protein n=1 Tax=Coprinopsis cinerea (strain Okayama-7 / 130 / ATCC MYA-4618 / FGSC 9003) TaxID=240176 RepID=A8NQ49_COPC7|nr:hypothetical protein CC1G_05443 [Coprinopsis cinerea okayama7\|eukprot:XP_001835481.2 hypothetical protein CC1G_05443 [Coprinopsis cinerea okayama7\